MLHILQVFFRVMLETFVQNISSVLDVSCNKCFILMLHMFPTYVASVLSGCCICFTHILQVFYLDVAYVSHMCCNTIFKCFICVRRMLHPVFYVASVLRGHGE
jgi:hypothetical protein